MEKKGGTTGNPSFTYVFLMCVEDGFLFLNHSITYMKEEIQNLIKNIVFDLYAIETDTKLEVPKDTTHGDLSSNIAMVLSKQVGKNPREVALEIVAKIKEQGSSVIEGVELAGPGFINIKLTNDSLSSILLEVLKKGSIYGKSSVGEGKQVMIEFGQPNTHKAFHVGHLKSAISGLSMVKLHENLGFEVIKANFYGDIGMQVAKPTWGFMHKETPEGFDSWNVHEQMKFIDECYAFGSTQFKENPEVEKEIRAINLSIYAGEDTKATKVYKKLREISLKHQSDVWKNLGIVYDREYPESEIYKDAIKIVDQFKESVFEESEGAIIYDGKKVGLTTWVFLTSEGNPTYSAKDLGLAYKKFTEYPNLEKGIVTTSSEIADYFKVVIHILGIINPKTKGRYFHIPFGWMLRGGRKFSSRMGGSIKGMDILDEVKKVSYDKISELKDYPEEEKLEIVQAVANAGLKFLILSHEFHKDFSYDPEQFLSFEGFSGPYILYTYARSKSILRKENVEDQIDADNLDLSLLTSEYETAVLKLIAEYPDVALSAGQNVTPHVVCTYLYKLAQTYNQFYTNCPVIKADSESLKNSRLALTQATAQVLKNGLNLLGIETVEKM